MYFTLQTYPVKFKYMYMYDMLYQGMFINRF